MSMGWEKPDIDCIKPGSRCALYYFDGALMMVGYEYRCPKCNKIYTFMGGEFYGIGKKMIRPHWKLTNSWWDHIKYNYYNSFWSEPEAVYLKVIIIVALALFVGVLFN